MQGRKHNKRKPLISERVEIQSDPFLHESPEVKSRLISELTASVLREKLTCLRQQHPSASKKELYNHLSNYLNRLSQREQTSRNLHG